MDLAEIKKYFEENKDKEEVKAFIQGLNPVTVDKVKAFVVNDKEAKSWLDSEKDKHSSKSLETWKTNNLQKLIDEAVAKANPQETPEQKQIRELTERLNKKEADEKRQVIKNHALTHANSKKLPVDLVDYFLGDSEETTTANLTKLEEIFNKHIQTAVEQRLKGENYVPPGDGDTNTLTLDQIKNMSQEQINANWDKISKLLKN